MTALKLPYEGIRLLMREISLLGFKRNLSIVCRDTENGKIAGCYINFDIGD